MARKRRIFAIRVQSQSFLKRAMIKYRNIIILVLCSLLGFSFTLFVPALSYDGRSQYDTELKMTQLKHYDYNNSIFLAQADNNPDILALAREGQRRYDAGQFSEAINLWQQAANAYQKVGDEPGVFKSLVNKAQALQNLGSYPRACNTLLQAFSIKQPNCNSEQVDLLLTQIAKNPQKLSLDEAIGIRSLGDVLRRQGKLKQSQQALEISLLKVQGSPREAATKLSLGNTARALGTQTRNRWNYEQITEIIVSQSRSDALEADISAIKFYQQVETDPSTPITTKVQAQLNHLNLLLDIRKWWNERGNQRIASWSRVDNSRLIQRAEGFLTLLNKELNTEISTLQTAIQSNIDNLPLNHSAVSAKINFADNSLKLSQIDRAEPLLKTVLKEARTLKDTEAESYSLGYMGQLYYKQWQQLNRNERQSRRGKKLLSRATQMTRQALLIASDASEIGYLWQSQLGNLLKERGDIKGAISSYFAAFNTLQSLRTDLNKNNQDLQFDFRQEIQPVYKSLADLLLKSDLSQSELESLVVLNPQTAQGKTQIKPQKSRLELARTVIESLQIAELDNFFQDPCLEETEITTQIDDLDKQAAVVYPILFSDRLEVIVSLPKKPLKQITIAIDEAEFNEALEKLYDNLYNESFDESAINIFRTVPLDPKEVEANTQKLLPILTQLYEWLIQPFESELKLSQIETLVFVLNDRLQRVPMAALYDGQQYLIENYGVALVPSLKLQSISNKQLKSSQLSILAAGVSQKIELGTQIFPALNNVPEELNQIETNCSNCQQLLNEEFSAERLKNELKERSYNVVHLATHGLFSSNPEKTFIITGNGESINIEQLRELLSTGEANIPELLVLSACDTATGDERAILGLAGVAVRSGTRSTIASLWPVGDKFTADLMDRFYQELRTSNEKKVYALKNAQLSLIDFLQKNPRFESLKHLPSHPYYWAPYVLVGNWQ